MLRTRDMLILIIQIKTLKNSSNTQTKRIKVLEKKVNNDVYAQQYGIFHYLKRYKQDATMTECREGINIFLSLSLVRCRFDFLYQYRYLFTIFKQLDWLYNRVGMRHLIG